MKAKFVQSRCLSLHVAIKDKMDAHAFGTSWTTVKSYIWRICIATSEAKFENHALRSSNTPRCKLEGVHHSVSGPGDDYPIVALRGKLHFEVGKFLDVFMVVKVDVMGIRFVFGPDLAWPLEEEWSNSMASTMLVFSMPMLAKSPGSGLVIDTSHGYDMGLPKE